MTINTVYDYWITPGSVYIEKNAMGRPDYVQSSCTSGSRIKVFISNIPALGYDAGHNYRMWNLKSSPTVFGTHTEKYVYVAIPKDEAQRDATIVFPSEKIDIYGKNEAGSQVGSDKCYYIYLHGKLTSSGDNGTTQREWEPRIDMGYLSSDEVVTTGSSGSWYNYSLVDGVVTFLREIEMSSTSFFRTMFAKAVTVMSGGSITFADLMKGGKIVGLAKNSTERTDEETIVTPKYLDAKAITKWKDEETAYDIKMKNMTATGKADVFGNLTVLGKADITGSAAIGGSVTIEGAAAVKSGLKVGDTQTKADSELHGDLKIGTYNKGIEGAMVDFYGNAEFESIVARSFLEVPELRYNRTTITVGNKWQTVGAGVVERVWEGGTSGVSSDFDIHEGIVRLKLEDGEPGAVAVGDKCQGVFHFVGKTNASANIDSRDGNYHFAGFTTVYFVVKEIYTVDTLPDFIKSELDASGETVGDNQYFRYELRAKTCSSLSASNRNRWTDASHPQQSMTFACYANANNSERQASRLTTTTYQLHLSGMTDWTYTQDNIRLIIGWLDGFTLLERVWNKTTKQYEQQAKELSGEGIAVGNMYMWGTIDQFDRAPSVVAQQLYYKSTQTNAAPDGMSVSSSYDVYYKNGWTKDPIKPSSSARYVWQQWLYTYSDGTYNVSDPSLSAIDNSILMTLLSRNLISVAISDWYDADAEDDISFDVTARITDGTAMLDITSATASCDADGVTMTYTSEVADDGKSVDFHVNLQGYVGVELNGVTPEDTFVRFTLGTAYGTASSTVAIAQNREGAAGADGQDGTDGESVVSVQLSTPVVAISTTDGSVSTGVADRDIYVSMYNGSTPMDCIVSTDWNQAMPFNVSVSGSVVKISAVAGTAWTSDTMLTIMASHITDTDEIVRTAQLNVVGSAQGQTVTGPQGASISRVEEAYKATATETAPAYNDTGWATSHIVPTAALPYVWNREIVYIKEQGSPETPISTDVHLCCVFSDGILTHTSEYAATKSRTSNPTSWTTLDAAMTKFSSTYRYLWNKEVATYKDTSKDTTTVRLIAVWGSQGESNFTLDLDNEMTSVGTDKDGLLSDAKSITLALNAYYGRTDKTSECAISVVNEAALPTGISVDLTTKSAPVVTIAAGTTIADTTEITFQAVHSTYGTRTAVFTLCAAKAGNEGADAELYELLPSVTSVVFTRAQDGTTLTPTSRKLTLSILHTKGSEQTVKSISSSGLTVRYSTSSTPANATAGSAFPETGVTIKSSTEKSALYIAAFNALGKLVDRETIPFLKDGQKGSSGSTPEIGENGNWFVDGEDTGFSSRGNNGYSPQKGANGNWWAWSTSANAYVDTGIAMQGASAHSPYVGTNGNWYVYDDVQGLYVDSGQSSRGDDGHTPYIGDDGFWYEYDADSGEYRKTDITARGADGDSAIYMHLSTPVVAVPTEDGAIATGAMPRTVNVALYNGSQPLDIQSLTTDWTSYMPFALSTEGSNIMLTFTAGRQWTDTMLTLTATAVVGTETITRSMQLNVVGSAQGQTVTGPQGASISRIVEAYKATASSNAPSASSSGWTSSHLAPTADLPYVWNREKIYVLDPTTNTESVVSTDVHLCCTFSDGIVSHTSTYCVTDTAAQPTSGWTTLDAAMQTFSADHRYMWNRETVVYKSGEENTNTRLIAVWGEKGEPGQKGDKGDTGQAAVYMHLSTPVVAVPTENGKIAAGAISRTVSVTMFSGNTQLTLQSLTTDWSQTMPFTADVDGSDVTLTFTPDTAWTSDSVLTLTARGMVGTRVVSRTMQLNVVGSAQGQTVTGPQGASISRIEESYKATADATAPLATDEGWDSSHLEPTAALPYVWNREIVYIKDPTETQPKVVSTDVHLCCVFSDGIVSHTSTYCVTDTAAQPASGWTTLNTAMQTFSADHRYMWNKEVVVYKSGVSNTNIRLIAVWGEKGDAGDSAIYMQLSTPVVSVPTKDGAITQGAMPRTITATMFNGSQPMVIQSLTTDWTAAMPFSVSIDGAALTLTFTAETPWTADTMLTLTATALDGTDTVTRTMQLNVVGSAQGQTVTGPQGASISKVEEYYLSTISNRAPITSDRAWSTVHVEPTSVRPYVWNKEVVSIKDPVTGTESVVSTDVHLCCTFSDGLLTHTSTYCVTDTSTQPASGWTTLTAAMQTFSADHRYLWNREEVTYKDSSSNRTDIRLVAVWGERGNDGEDALEVYLENDTILFSQKNDTGITYIDVWKGSEQIPYDSDTTDGYTLSTLGQSNLIVDGNVQYVFRLDTASGRASYRFKCLTDDLTLIDGKKVSFTITYGTRTITRNITFRHLRQGDRGYDGAAIRRSEWQAGVYYRNDSDDNTHDTDGNSYLDVVCITNPVTGNASWYVARPAHNGVLSSSDNKPQGVTNDYWTVINDMQPIRTPYADIQNAFIEFLQARQLTIANSDGIYGAFGGGTDWPLWFGGTTAESAVARFNKHGDLYLGNSFSVVQGVVRAVSGVFAGWVKGDPLRITSGNILNFVTYGTYFDTSTHTTRHCWVLDIMKTGPNIVFYDDSSSQYEEQLGGCANLDVTLRNAAIDAKYNLVGSWDGRLHIHLPWYSPYAISGGEPYTFAVKDGDYEWCATHGINVRDEMNAAFGLLGTEFHLINASNLDIHIDYGMTPTHDNVSLPFPTDDSLKIDGSSNGRGREFYARSTYTRFQDDYEGDRRNGYCAVWNVLFNDASNLLSRIHATYVATRTS